MPTEDRTNLPNVLNGRPKRLLNTKCPFQQKQNKSPLWSLDFNQCTNFDWGNFVTNYYELSGLKTHIYYLTIPTGQEVKHIFA